MKSFSCRLSFVVLSLHFAFSHYTVQTEPVNKKEYINYPIFVSSCHRAHERADELATECPTKESDAWNEGSRTKWSLVRECAVKPTRLRVVPAHLFHVFDFLARHYRRRVRCEGEESTRISVVFVKFLLRRI